MKFKTAEYVQVIAHKHDWLTCIDTFVCVLYSVILAYCNTVIFYISTNI